MTPGFALPSNLEALRPCSRPRARLIAAKRSRHLVLPCLANGRRAFGATNFRIPDYKCIGAELGAPTEHARPSARHNEYPVKLGRIAPSRCKLPAGAFRLSACPSATRSEMESQGCRSVPHHRPKQCDHRRTWKSPLCTSMGATMDHASPGANGLMATRRQF